MLHRIGRLRIDARLEHEDAPIQFHPQTDAHRVHRLGAIIQTAPRFLVARPPADAEFKLVNRIARRRLRLGVRDAGVRIFRLELAELAVVQHQEELPLHRVEQAFVGIEGRAQVLRLHSGRERIERRLGC